MGFKMFLLLLIILGCGLFIYIKAQTLGSDSSQFNQTTRFTLGKHPVLRNIFALHKDGDARAEYLQGSATIEIEIAEPGNSQLDETTVDDFAAKVSKYTGRSTKVYYVDNVPNGTLSNTQIDNVFALGKRQYNPGDSVLFVLYANDFNASDNEVGRTYQEYGMVISHDKLQTLTQAYPSSFDQYAESTMLHEFGHQLGLDHNNINGCIMNSVVENPQSYSVFGSYTPTDFCQSELDQLEQVKSHL